MHDFAVKSVDQAERAISSFMELASKSVAMAPSPMHDAAQQVLALLPPGEVLRKKSLT